MTAIAALATATVARPDGPVPAALEPAIRAACAAAWRAIEVVLAGDALRSRLGGAKDARVRDGALAVLGLFGAEVATRTDALTELRAARRAGALDGALDMTALAASCARAGDTTVVSAGRRRVRAQAIEKLKVELAAYRALATAVGESAIAAVLVDVARALFRYAVRDDKDLVRWAVAPTGTNTRESALTAFAELAAKPAAIEELDRLISTPVKLDENVQFTIYRPKAIEPKTWHPLLAFAHLAERRPEEAEAPDPVEEVRKQAAAILGDKVKTYQPIVQDSGSAIPAEGELTFVPEIAGVEFNPPRRTFLWLEPVHREDFRMRAGADLDGTTARGRMTVFLGAIVIAEIALSVRVDAAHPEPVQEATKARTYRKIFASYSHRDVAIVNQFEQYARALGDEYLRDWIHLRTGEVWNDRLRQLIEQADAFQLFWSTNAMGSAFVKLEYEHALSLNRPSFVRPTYWEEPMPTAPGLPPEALLRLHFQKIGGGATAIVGAGSRSVAAPEPMIVESERALEMPAEASVEPPPDAAPERPTEPLLPAPAPAPMAAPPAPSPAPAPSKVVAAARRSEPEMKRAKVSTAPVDAVKEEVAAEPVAPKLDAAAPADPAPPKPEPMQLEEAAPAKLVPAPGQDAMASMAAPKERKNQELSAAKPAEAPPAPQFSSRTWLILAILLIVAIVVLYLTW